MSVTSDGSTIIPRTRGREECEASRVAHRRPWSATPATSASARTQLVATGNSVLTVIYHLLSDPDARFCDLGHQEWLKFLKTIDRQVPKDLQIHLILDNYATHNHEDVRTWLDKHPRFHLHFTPTSSSWLNLVVRHESRMSTAELTERSIG